MSTPIPFATVVYAGSSLHSSKSHPLSSIQSVHFAVSPLKNILVSSVIFGLLSLIGLSTNVSSIWGSGFEPFRRPDRLKDLDIFLVGLNEEFVAELAAKSMRRVWDKKTKDPFKGNSTQFHDTEKSVR